MTAQFPVRRTTSAPRRDATLHGLRARYVTACQQLLVVGVIGAALLPATGVVNLTMISTPTNESMSTGSASGELESLVDTAPVKPTITNVALATQDLIGKVLPHRSTVVTSPVTAVTGFGAVGVTWSRAADFATGDVAIAVRTRTDDVWTRWQAMEAEADGEDGPDPQSAEGRNARPGTDAYIVGDADAVQVRATALPGVEIPADLSLAVINAGTDAHQAVEAPALDTSNPAGDYAALPKGESLASSEGDLNLSASTVTPMPQIYSRAQWGADESMRDPGSLHYFEVHAGFIHHTVNSNDYTRDEVPAIIRSIYAYHVRSRGWSDIGYNFLVDRFGRIWEGRYGGINRAVVGAHTLGYNEYSFAASGIGNFELVEPSKAMLQAFAKIMAWKLSLHGVSADSTDQIVAGDHFQAINGHRDAASTACPGKFLYAKLPWIRQRAAQLQADWSGRDLESDLVGNNLPDLIVRNADNGRLYVLGMDGKSGFEKPSVAGVATGATSVISSADLNGDDRPDVLVQGSDGKWRRASVLASGSLGDFSAPIKALTALTRVTAVGNVDRRGGNDLVGVNDKGRLITLLGNGHGRFSTVENGLGWLKYDLVTASDLSGDGLTDLVARRDNHLYLRARTKDGWAPEVELAGTKWDSFDTITGRGDLNRDGHSDLVARVAGGRTWILPVLDDAKFGRRIGPFSSFSNVASMTAYPVVSGPLPDLVGLYGDKIVTIANSDVTEMLAPIDTGIPATMATRVLQVGDWNLDGFGDIMVRGADGSLWLRLGAGDDTFSKASKISTNFSGVRLIAAVGDMTGDGFPDLMGQPTDGDMRLYPGRGTTSLGASYAAFGSLKGVAQIGMGLWDDDGSPDTMIRRGATSDVYLGNGPGGLTKKISIPLDTRPYDWFFPVADADGDGHGDALAREKSTGYLWLVTLTETGIKSRTFLAEGMKQYNLAG